MIETPSNENYSEDPASEPASTEPLDWLGDVAPPIPVVRLPQPGETIDHYVVVALVGEGAFGRVYQVHNKHLQREETLKLHRYQGGSVPSELRLDLPKGVRIQVLSHHGQYRGRPYLTYFPFLEGESLQQRIAHGPLSEQEASRVSHDLAVLLRELHGRSIVHRDIKPSNVLVERTGDVWLLDFGFACTQGAPTRPGELCGTPGYVSPEQAKGERVDSRSDVFSAAVLLYACLGGSVPLRWGTTRRDQLVPAIIEPAQVRALRVSRALERLILSGCCLDVEQRPDITAWEAELGKLRAPRRTTTLRSYLSTLLALLFAALTGAGLARACDTGPRALASLEP